MIPELQQRLEEIEAARHKIHELVSGVDDVRFNQRIDERRWSMAECVDHLITVGWQTAPRIDTAMIEGRGKGRTSEGPFTYGRFGCWFARQMGAVELPPRGKYRAPRLYVPERRPDWKIPTAVEEFSNLQEKFTSIIKSADGLDLARIKVTSPVTRLLRLSLGLWLQGLAGHQLRHLWQAEQVRRDFS
jgi:hypothetical protein